MRERKPRRKLKQGEIICPICARIVKHRNSNEHHIWLKCDRRNRRWLNAYRVRMCKQCHDHLHNDLRIVSGCDPVEWAHLPEPIRELMREQTWWIRNRKKLNIYQVAEWDTKYMEIVDKCLDYGYKIDYLLYVFETINFIYTKEGIGEED